VLLAAYDPSTNPINIYGWAFPFLECVHIPSFALSIGTIALVDVRLLGLGLQRQAPAQLVKDTSAFTLAGLITVIVSGVLLFSTDPLHYYYNSAFRFKVICLVLGIVFNFTIHRKVALNTDSSVTASRLAGAASLLIWVCVVFGGVFYSFY
jgi:hypothetical protein